MRQFGAEAGGRKSLPSWARRLASTGAAALLLLVGSAAKADVAATFHISGNLNTELALLRLGPLVPFTGTIQLDINDDFVHDTVKSFQITVEGHVFRQSPSVHLAMSSLGVISASDSSGDALSLTFTTPNPGTWNDFDEGEISLISFGYVVFGGAGESLLGAKGDITSTHPIIDPPDPPPTESVPELSTWAMMLVGFAGLGLAAKGRHALAFLGGRA